MTRTSATLEPAGQPVSVAGPRARSFPTNAAEDVAPPLERLIAGEYGRWLPVAGLWLALALLVAFGVFVSDTAQGRADGLARVLFATVPHFVAWILVTPALYRALYEVVEGARRPIALALLAAWSAIAIGASTLFCYLGIALRGGSRPTAAGLFDLLVAPPMGPAYQAMNSTILLVALSGLGMLLAIRLRARARWDAAQARLAAAELQARLAETRLQALQSRINPHFLLNSLNAIAGHVQFGQPDEACATVTRLGTLLQSVLRHGESRDISLGEEFDFVESYVQLLEMRFGPRFRYDVSIPDRLRAQRVPALIVQPLIENAVRHGMQADRPLHVGVRAFQQDAAVVIEVEDDGHGLAAAVPATLPEGHGLSNVAERLRIVFGDRGRLEIAPRTPRGAIARLSFAA